MLYHCLLSKGETSETTTNVKFICFSFSIFSQIFSLLLVSLIAGVQDDEDVKQMLQGSSMLKVTAPSCQWSHILAKLGWSLMLCSKVRSAHWQKRRTLKLLEDGVTIWCQSHKTSSRAKEQQSCKYDFKWVSSSFCQPVLSLISVLLLKSISLTNFSLDSLSTHGWVVLTHLLVKFTWNVITGM